MTALGTMIAIVAAAGWTAGRQGTAVGAPAGAEPQRTRPAAVHEVTLLTGDKVVLRTGSTGKPTVQVVRGPGRARVPYATRAYGSHLFVEPADAQALIAAGRLDARLFDVTQLVAWGYDDAHTADIPIIAQGGAAADVPGTHATKTMAALGMTATRLRKAGAAAAWHGLTGSAARPATFAAGTSMKRLWLDGKLRPADDVSAAQVGAPTAWNSGLTGAGVTVAVLDGGYDPAHQDLTGVVTQSRGFTDEGASDVTDRLGHGTHVASILAGSGAASNGRFQGIAHGAKLAIGKVCDDGGLCDTSWVLAGMSWAAQTVKARVVNLSLGGPDAAGLDPLEDAVNTLTEQTGTLFVIAAGNDGSDGTIESPGSADAALTVGAVDSADALAPFSSRGPRRGDYAIKPDLTAPGVDITAAKAAGSAIGTPVGSAYQKLSGTSMATPHVSGAAAIVAQQHPNWTAARLKAALTSSARPGANAAAYQAGDGRLDIARAITQPVTAAPAGVSAYLAWPHAAGQAETKSYTYTNDGSSPVTLSLGVRATGAGGAAAPAGLFRPGRDTVTVPAGGTADVAVTIAADGVPPGVYSGLITATSADGQVVVRTGVGAYVEPEAADVTVATTGRDGAPSDAVVDFFDPSTGGVTEVDTSDGSGSVRLVAKQYVVYSAVFTEDGAGATNVASLLQPFTVGQSNRQVTLDARAAKPVTVSVDRPDAVATVDAMSTYNGSGGAFLGIGGGASGQVFVLPVKDNHLVFNAQSVWTQQGASEAAPGAFRYDLADVSRGEVPANPAFAHQTADLAAISTTVRSTAAPVIGSHVWAPVLPDVFLSFGTGVPMRLPAAQTEFVTPQVSYSRTLFSGPSDETLLQGGVQGAANKAYDKQSYTETWNAAAIGPAFPAVGSDRNGDVLTYGGDGLFSDAAADHVGRDTRATGTVELARDGTLIKSDELHSGFATLSATLPADPATYALSVSARRQAADAALSTAVSATWTFTSGHITGRQALPLLAARFAVPGIGDDNQGAAGGTVSLPVQVVRNPGAAQASITDLTVQTSADDGKTWQTVPVAASGDGWVATVTNPPGAGFVSLRASAADSAGNSVEQTIVRAYAVR